MRHGSPSTSTRATSRGCSSRISAGNARLEAVAAGADGFVSRQDSVTDLLERVRATVDRTMQPGEVFVIAEPGETRDGWMEALIGAGFGAVASDQPAEIAPALDVVCPDVLVVAGTVSEVWDEAWDSGRVGQLSASRASSRRA